MIMLSTLTIGNVDARDMSPYTCTPNNDGTIGTTKCCAIDLNTSYYWCTTCDNTTPPSNCGPAVQQPHTKGGDNVNPKDNGGVLSNNDDSSNSGIPKGIDPSTGGTFNENSESSNQDNSKGIDPNNSGGIFSQ